MINSKPYDPEKPSLKGFCDFVESEPLTPSTKTELGIMQKVAADLCPLQWLVFGKLFVVEAVAGVATLFVCPQFGLGFGGHNELLHALHETASPFMFYLICGLIFVVVGAAIGGVFLSRDEIRTIKKSKYAYYPVYAFTVYFIFAQFGGEVLIISLMPWVIGSVLGNAFGFGLASRIRYASIITN